MVPPSSSTPIQSQPSVSALPTPPAIPSPTGPSPEALIQIENAKIQMVSEITRLEQKVSTLVEGLIRMPTSESEKTTFDDLRLTFAELSEAMAKLSLFNIKATALDPNNPKVSSEAYYRISSLAGRQRAYVDKVSRATVVEQAALAALPAFPPEGADVVMCAYKLALATFEAKKARTQANLAVSDLKSLGEIASILSTSPTTGTRNFAGTIRKAVELAQSRVKRLESETKLANKRVQEAKTAVELAKRGGAATTSVPPAPAISAASTAVPPTVSATSAASPSPAERSAVPERVTLLREVQDKFQPVDHLVNVSPASLVPSETGPSSAALDAVKRLPLLLPGTNEFRTVKRELNKIYTSQISRFKESTELALLQQLDVDMLAISKTTLDMEIQLLRYQTALNKMKQTQPHFFMDKQIGTSTQNRLDAIQHVQNSIREIQQNIRDIERILPEKRKKPYYSQSEKPAEIVADRKEAMKRVSDFLYPNSSDPPPPANAIALEDTRPKKPPIRGAEKGEDANIFCIYHETKIPTTKTESVVAKSVIVQSKHAGGVTTELYTDNHPAFIAQPDSLAKNVGRTIFRRVRLPRDFIITDALTFVDNHLKQYQGKQLPLDSKGNPIPFTIRVNTASPEMVEAISLAFIYRGQLRPTVNPISKQVKITPMQEKAFAKKMKDDALKATLTLEQQVGSKQAEKEKKVVAPRGSSLPERHKL